jgi:hypothetical protein
MRRSPPENTSLLPFHPFSGAATMIKSVSIIKTWIISLAMTFAENLKPIVSRATGPRAARGRMIIYSLADSIGGYNPNNITVGGVLMLNRFLSRRERPLR